MRRFPRGRRVTRIVFRSRWFSISAQRASRLIPVYPDSLDLTQKSLLMEIGKSLEYKSLDDWYRLSVRDLSRDSRLGAVLAAFEWSPSQIVASLFPDHTWLPWKFVQRPRNLFDSPASHRMFFDWLKDELQYPSLDGFYSLTLKDISKYGGYSLVNKYYSKNIARAVMTCYPQHEWHPWLFSSVPQGWWKDAIMRRRFFDDAAAQLQLSGLQSWMEVKQKSVENLKGSSFLVQGYGSSLRAALRDTYPEHTWDLDHGLSGQHITTDLPRLNRNYPTWRAPAGYWKSVANRRAFFENLAKKLNYQTLDDWYHLNTETIRIHGGSGLISRYYRNSFVAALVDLFPDHKWDLHAFYRKSKVHSHDGDPANVP